MDDLWVVPALAAPPARRRRWLAVVAGAIALLVAGIVTALVVTFRYLHAPPLTNAGGSYGWGSPDSLRGHSVDLGPYSGLVAPARPGHSQSFYVDVINDSSVTQTILGIDDFGTGLAQREHVAVSAGYDFRLGSDQQTFRTGAVPVPPHAQRVVRYTIDTPRCPGPKRQYWDSLRLRVRVGAFTRTETITMNNTIFELTSPRSTC